MPNISRHGGMTMILPAVDTEASAMPIMLCVQQNGRWLYVVEVVTGAPQLPDQSKQGSRTRGRGLSQTKISVQRPQNVWMQLHNCPTRGAGKKEGRVVPAQRNPKRQASRRQKGDREGVHATQRTPPQDEATTKRGHTKHTQPTNQPTKPPPCRPPPPRPSPRPSRNR